MGALKRNVDGTNVKKIEVTLIIYLGIFPKKFSCILVLNSQC